MSINANWKKYTSVAVGDGAELYGSIAWDGQDK